MTPLRSGDVVGSLLRPDYSKEARKRREAWASSAPREFKHVEDRAVNEAIDLQIQAGMDVVSDGELRRYAFYGHFVDAARRLRQIWRLGHPVSRRTGRRASFSGVPSWSHG
jgi:methionine synthase II (cobalamin-independent)